MLESLNRISPQSDAKYTGLFGTSPSDSIENGRLDTLFSDTAFSGTAQRRDVLGIAVSDPFKKPGSDSFVKPSFGTPSPTFIEKALSGSDSVGGGAVASAWSPSRLEILANQPSFQLGSVQDKTSLEAQSLSSGRPETQSGISGDIALAAQRTRKAEFVPVEYWGWKGSEIKNNTKWHSESTFRKDEYWSNMEMAIYPGGERKFGSFQEYGCHATALLNAINTVAGTNATPRNARDYAGGFEGTRDARDPKQTDTRDVFLQAARKVEFVDISVPGQARSIKTKNLFTEPAGNTTLDAQLIERIKNNVRAGNPVMIGIASTPGGWLGGTNVRHSAVVTGIVTKDGKEQLIVRDNWKSDNGEAKLMTLDDFLKSYGRKIDETKLDFVWATRSR
jgi:hypothetical protein